MASDRKTDYVFYERKVRDDKEIESLLLQGDDDENDEWVVQKSAKKLTPSSKQKNGISNGNHTDFQSSIKSPRKPIDSPIVSPIKIKRKLSYAVTKVDTPPKKRPEIVSPILIKRIPDTDTVTVICSPSACVKKPTIELTSSEDDERPRKSKPTKRNKKRRKSVDPSDADEEVKWTATSTKPTPRKRKTYFEGSEDDEFELHKARPSRQMPPRKSKPVKLIESAEEEQTIKRTPSRRCKFEQASPVMAALEAVESKTLSPSKSGPWKVDSAESRCVPNGVDTPSKSSNLDSESDYPSTPRTRPTRERRSLFKTPSKVNLPGEVATPDKPARTPAQNEALHSADAISKADATPERGSTPGRSVTKSTRSTPAKGSTPSKSTTPAKPCSVVIPVSSSEDDEEELATPLRRSYTRAAKSKPPPKVETPLKMIARTPLRRSARVSSMSPSTPSLRQKVLLANTPRSSLPPLKDESEPEEEFASPRKTPKSAKKKLDLTSSTPSSSKVGHGFLSPVVAEREKRGLSTPSSELEVARAQLQVSTLPQSLPCREKEFSDIQNFIVRKLKDGTGGCMYVSGVPGTGKTATVHTVVRALQKMTEDRELAAFDFVEVNGLRLTEPRQAYVRIWQCLSKNKVTPDQALKNLETKFNGKPKRSTVLLVDELDYLCNRRQDVIYNILDWTTKRHSKLVVLTIANTMDLPERTLKGKVTSRMGLTRLVFQPYNFHQLEEIVLNRLDGCKAFNPDAVQLVARKVAAVSGDARRALDICRRSTEILELEGQTNVSVLDIQKVLTQIFAGSRVQAIKNSSVAAKLVLRAIKDEVLRTGVEETTIAFIHPQLVSICALEGKRELTITDLLAICSNLAESGLIFAEKGRKDISRKISLNVSTDDIHYAINC